jgi:hypothetical protein
MVGERAGIKTGMDMGGKLTKGKQHLSLPVKHPKDSVKIYGIEGLPRELSIEFKVLNIFGVHNEQIMTL